MCEIWRHLLTRDSSFFLSLLSNGCFVIAVLVRNDPLECFDSSCVRQQRTLCNGTMSTTCFERIRSTVDMSDVAGDMTMNIRMHER
jgi:hypothetical protein